MAEAPGHVVAEARIPVVPDLGDWERFKREADEWVEGFKGRLADAVNLAGPLDQLRGQLDQVIARLDAVEQFRIARRDPLPLQPTEGPDAPEAPAGGAAPFADDPGAAGQREVVEQLQMLRTSVDRIADSVEAIEQAQQVAGE
jgi:hypothetical protein